MRLLTFRNEEGETHVGALRGEQVVDLTVWFSREVLQAGSPPLSMVALIAMGDKGLEHASRALEAGPLIEVAPERILAPIPRPPKNVMCLGRNYAEHRAESIRAFGEKEAPPPEFPTFFTKAPTAVIGPYADSPFDSRVSAKIDWEGELAFVIGTQGKNLPRQGALGYVFGYTVLNDISARDVQKQHGGQYFKGKSLDGTCPMGPWIVTADELGDPSTLELWTRVNGVEKQHGHTRDMIFDIPATIESLSLGMTLEPGDIVATGTPAGVGHGRVPPEFLRPGDVVEVEISRIGTIRNRISGE